MGILLAVRWLQGLARRRWLAVCFCAVLAGAFLSPLWQSPSRLGHGDWLWFHFIWDTSRKSLTSFGEPLLWNPYYCGGNYGLANPQSLWLSPFFLALLPLPTAVGMKAFLTLHVFLAAWGMWELCRRFYGSGIGALAAAVGFGCSGVLGWHLNGQLAMAGFGLVPWVFLGVLEGRNRPLGSLLAGLVLAIALFGGGVYPSVLGAIAVAVFVLAGVLVEGRAALPLVRSGVVALAAFGGLSAIKLVPVLHVLREHPRVIASDDSIPLWLVPRMLLEKRTTETQIWDHPGLHYAWWGEYGNYVGVVGILLFGSALVLARHGVRERLALAFCGLLLLGDHGWLSPYHLLRSLPIGASLRVPTRYWVLVSFFAALLLSLFVQQAIRHLSSRRAPWGRRAALLLVLCSLAFFSLDLVQTNGVAVMRGALPSPPAPADEPFVAFHQVTGRAWPMTDFPPRHQGTLRCFDEIRVPPAPGLRAGLPSEIFLEDPGAGRLSVQRWTPNRVTVRVESVAPATVVYNQSFSSGWQAQGGELVTPRGLIGATVPAGTHELTFFYRPPGLWLGAALSMLTLVLLGATVRRHPQGWTNTKVP